jgi:hypothetical protein
MRWLSVNGATRWGERVVKGCGPRSSGRDGHARYPALEPCEGRILQSIAVEPAGIRYNDVKLTLPQQAALAPDGSRVVVLDGARLDPASERFDDPFFFDVN